MVLESDLYEPIKKHLHDIFSGWYIDKDKKPQFMSHLFEYEDNPYLEITANGKLSERLKREFSNEHQECVEYGIRYAHHSSSYERFARAIKEEIPLYIGKNIMKRDPVPYEKEVRERFSRPR